MSDVVNEISCQGNCRCNSRFMVDASTQTPQPPIVRLVGLEEDVSESSWLRQTSYPIDPHPLTWGQICTELCTIVDEVRQSYRHWQLSGDEVVQPSYLHLVCSWIFQTLSQPSRRRSPDGSTYFRRPSS